MTSVVLGLVKSTEVQSVSMVKILRKKSESGTEVKAIRISHAKICTKKHNENVFRTWI
jgi:hypothetical protein